MAGKANCSVDGCPNVVNGHGLCQGHQIRLRNGQPLTPLRTYRRQGCTVDDCPQPHHAQGYCRKHYLRWKRTEGQRVLDHQRWPRMDEVGYHAVHKRLWRDIGHPTTLPCVDCGSEGAEWSYVGDCPDEQRQTLRGVNMAYCTHPDHYSVRCVTCHKRYDAA